MKHEHVIYILHEYLMLSQQEQSPVTVTNFLQPFHCSWWG